MTINYPRRQAFQRNEVFSRNRPFVVDGLTLRVHHAPDQRVTYGHAHNAPGALDLVALFDFGVLAEQHDANLVFLQVHGNSGQSVRKAEQLAGHDFVQAVNAGDTVSQRDYCADFVHSNLRFIILDLLPD